MRCVVGWGWSVTMLRMAFVPQLQSCCLITANQSVPLGGV